MRKQKNLNILLVKKKIFRHCLEIAENNPFGGRPKTQKAIESLIVWRAG